MPNFLLNPQLSESYEGADAHRNMLLDRNMQYAMQPSLMTGSYVTALSPLEEMAFQAWAKKNNVPFDDSPDADYDMRGFYKALTNKDTRASSGMNSNDGQMHYTDHFKTPYHESFSEESRFAKKGAPRWNEYDQLGLPSGRLVFDERAKHGK